MRADKIRVDLCASCGLPRPCSCEREYGYIVKSKKRWRNKDYLRFVRSLPCSVPGCLNRNVEAAHFGKRAVGEKVHDCLAIPLCHEHHMESHASGALWEWDEFVVEWQLKTMTSALIMLADKGRLS